LRVTVAGVGRGRKRATNEGAIVVGACGGIVVGAFERTPGCWRPPRRLITAGDCARRRGGWSPGAIWPPARPSFERPYDAPGPPSDGERRALTESVARLAGAFLQGRDRRGYAAVAALGQGAHGRLARQEVGDDQGEQDDEDLQAQ